MKTKVYEMLYICPVCGERFEKLEGKIVCHKGHSFDRSRRGYYNLLLGKGGTHGDNKDMVLARRAFLEGGYYEPLSDMVRELALKYTAPLGRVLDLGCGEGYYTSAVESALFRRDGESYVFGYDISKDAVSEAAKKNSRLRLAVFGSYHMPIEDESVDTAINIFSPLAIDETMRVLKRGGVFIMTIPDEEHLFELKQVLYDTPYKNTPSNTEISGFELLSDLTLRYNMHLDTREKIKTLFMMTPYAYRTKQDAANRLYGLSCLDCTAHFRVLAYRKA